MVIRTPVVYDRSYYSLEDDPTQSRMYLIITNSVMLPDWDSAINFITFQAFRCPGVVVFGKGSDKLGYLLTEKYNCFSFYIFFLSNSILLLVLGELYHLHLLVFSMLAGGFAVLHRRLFIFFFFLSFFLFNFIPHFRLFLFFFFFFSSAKLIFLT